jgi:hypothetical protein
MVEDYGDRQQHGSAEELDFLTVRKHEQGVLTRL